MRRSKETGIEDNDFFWGRPNLEADVPNITFNVIIVREVVLLLGRCDFLIRITRSWLRICERTFLSR